MPKKYRKKTLSLKIESKRSKGSKSGKSRRPRSCLDGREFSCIFCSKAYFRRNALVAHVKNKHTSEVEVRGFLESLRNRKNSFQPGPDQPASDPMDSSS